jgi:hypothetical protein
MKKIIVFVLLIIFSIGCQTSKTENVEVNQQKIEATPTPTPKVEIPDLTKEQKKKLENSLPVEARKILENAEEFEVFQGRDGSTDFIPIKELTIKEKSVMNNLTKALYLDVVNPANKATCFVPRHSLQAKFEGKFLRLVICYECSQLQGEVSGNEFSSTINEDFSKAIFDKILEKAEKVK